MINRLESKEVVPALILFCCALAVHSFRLFDMDLWFDEVAILFQLKLDFTGIWEFCKTENFPPLYPWLAKLWRMLLGSDLGIRYSSVLIGALTPVVFYVLGRQFGDRKFAFLFGLTGVFAGPFLYFSQVIRMYGLFILLAALSYLFFIKALKSESWKFWILTALVNMLAFYTFLFAVFFIASEFLILLWIRKFALRRYLRPVVAHIPAILLMLLWVSTLLIRYKVHGSYLTASPPFQEFYEFWVYFGTGVNFGNWALALLINLPVIIGFFIGVSRSIKKGIVTPLVWIFIISVILVLSTSLLGSGFFWRRYMLFLLPIYLILAIDGWYYLSNKLLRFIGLGALFLTLLLGTISFYSNYAEAHDLFRNRWQTIENLDGHSMSEGAKYIDDLYKKGDVIVHYSAPRVRSFTFFPFIYYHDRKYPEYLLAEGKIAEHAGAQYLKPGDTIKSFDDLNPEPKGIFIVTLADPFLIMSDSEEAQRKRLLLEHRLKFLFDMYAAGFVPKKSETYGNLSIIYFEKPADTVLHESQKQSP